MRKQQYRQERTFRGVEVRGIEHGCGCTYVSLAMATYCSQVMEDRTAYLEVSHTRQISSMCSRVIEKGAYFRYQGIYIYPEITNGHDEVITGGNFDTTILDRGYTHSNNTYHEFNVMRRFVVCNTVLWKRERIEAWLRDREKHMNFNYECIIRECTSRDIKHLFHSYHITFHEIPYISNPFDLNPEAIHFFHQLFL